MTRPPDHVPSDRLFISVIGGSRVTDEYARMAYEVGRELALRGAVVVCGGLTGVMEEACRGAKEAGGLTIGILPGLRREDANPYVDIPIVTGLGYARNVSVVLSGQAAIAIDGSFGTLSEIAYARTFNIPVIGLHTWTVDSPGLEQPPYILAETPQEAVEKAIAAAREAVGVVLPGG